MDDYYRALAAAVTSHGGTVVKLLGDGVTAFGVPAWPRTRLSRARRRCDAARLRPSPGARRVGDLTCASASTPARSSAPTTPT